MSAMVRRPPCPATGRAWYLVAAACGALMLCEPAAAYVGPGAGFAFFSAFFYVAASFVLALAALAAWPLRWLIGAVVRQRRLRGRRVRRVVVLGLDGLDPVVAEGLMARGRLPHLKALREQGCLRLLQTTVPAESPVAWSSFLTGCQPGKHRVYDFLVPDRRRLRPRLAAGQVATSSRLLRLGPYRIPLRRPKTTGGRRSRPFWHVLSDHGISSTVLRVPASFPPEPFGGVLLSAMFVPDLRGTQGTYCYFTSDPDDRPSLRHGERLDLSWREGRAHGALPGPAHPLRPDRGDLALPFSLEPTGADRAELRVCRQRHTLHVGRHSPWVRVAFAAGLGVSVHGICRFLLLEVGARLRVYVTPVQIDPARPALPIGHPLAYSVYLARELGSFATLGMAEDTAALNEGVIDEQAFLEQVREVHSEREAMLFDALDKTRQGLVVCVFDGADRVQHMCWRGPGRAPRTESAQSDGSGAGGDGPGPLVEDAYRLMDDLVGRARMRLGPDTALLVMSDHGFTAFRRQMDLNAWLRERGYLRIVPERAGEDLLGGVDWESSRAYAVGFGGVYLNLRGREARGIVSPGAEAEALVGRLAAELLTVADGDARPVSRVYVGREVYHGPYAEEAPDLVVGLQAGYRVSWETVTGGAGSAVFSDNPKAWSGDHTADPALVPGVLFSDQPLREGAARIVDVAPTVLDLLGVPVPAYMDGRSLLPLPVAEG